MLWVGLLYDFFEALEVDSLALCSVKRILSKNLLLSLQFKDAATLQREEVDPCKNQDPD